MYNCTLQSLCNFTGSKFLRGILLQCSVYLIETFFPSEKDIVRISLSMKIIILGFQRFRADYPCNFMNNPCHVFSIYYQDKFGGPCTYTNFKLKSTVRTPPLPPPIFMHVNAYSLFSTFEKILRTFFST